MEIASPSDFLVFVSFIVYHLGGHSTQRTEVKSLQFDSYEIGLSRVKFQEDGFNIAGNNNNNNKRSATHEIAIRPFQGWLPT
jgi:hypothetical protein